MSAHPPPIEESPKKILPAFLLCFAICAHRLYAGRIISGIVQLAWVGDSLFWVKQAFGELMAITSSAPFSMATVQRIGEWEQIHGVPIAPMLALIAVGIWIAADAALLIGGKFTDSQGRRITRWV